MSPDGRIALDLWVLDDEEAVRFGGGPYASPRVIDLQTGRIVLDLFAMRLLAIPSWPVEGGLELVLPRATTTVRIAPDGQSWSSDFDGWQAHPAGEHVDKLRRAIELNQSRVLSRPRAVAPADARGGKGKGTWVVGGVLAVTAVLFAMAIRDEGWSWPRKYIGLDLGQQANAWLPRCPAPVGSLILSLDEERDLITVRPMQGGAPWPVLPRLPGEGRRYGDGQRMVEPLDTGGARVWPQGAAGPVVECPSQRGEP